MDHVETIRREGTALVEAAEEAGLHAPVTACPGWDVRRLLQHTAKVHQRTEVVVRTGADTPPSSKDFPRFDDDYRLFAQFRGTLDALCLTLENADPEARCWNFTEGSGPNAFWNRRMAHETTVHRIDAQRAAGLDADPVPATQAADGIDELVTVLVPMVVGLSAPTWSGSVHLHCTDEPGEWTLRLADGALDVSRDHEKGDLAVRGPAAGMFVWSWSRASPDDAGLECFGDTGLLDHWGSIVP